MREKTALGNLIGGSSYFGSCPKCGAQHMSTHDMVREEAAGLVCERCADKLPDMAPRGWSTVDCGGRYKAAEAVGRAFDNCAHSMDPEHRPAALAAGKEAEAFLKTVRTKARAVEVLEALGKTAYPEEKLTSLKLSIEVAMNQSWFPNRYVNERTN